MIAFANLANDLKTRRAAIRSFPNWINNAALWGMRLLRSDVYLAQIVYSGEMFTWEFNLSARSLTHEDGAVRLHNKGKRVFYKLTS